MGSVCRVERHKAWSPLLARNSGRACSAAVSSPSRSVEFERGGRAGLPAAPGGAAAGLAAATAARFLLGRSRGNGRGDNCSDGPGDGRGVPAVRAAGLLPAATGLAGGDGGCSRLTRSSNAAADSRGGGILSGYRHQWWPSPKRRLPVLPRGIRSKRPSASGAQVARTRGRRARASTGRFQSGRVGCLHDGTRPWLPRGAGPPAA